ncbi:MAG: L-threonylcarbamoyladenylate synthase [Beijerinckiaceae bacterium]
MVNIAERGLIVPADADAILAAAAMIVAGDIVGMPTETVYGLAADATNGEAVARIYEAKGRPSFNPLISHLASLEEAERHGVFDSHARRLAAAFWPGPLTLVLPHRPESGISDLARAGLDTVALRVPGHPVARALIAAAGRPLAAPSANLSGHVSPTRARDVFEDLGDKVAVILDGGDCEIGLESTVVSAFEGRLTLLRPGAITVAEIEAIAGSAVLAWNHGEKVASPGQLLAHYAPNAPVQINCASPAKDAVFLAYGRQSNWFKTTLFPIINLSPAGDLRQCAARLFSALREADALRPDIICVAPIPEEGVGIAINDRLLRAAAGRNKP